MGGNHIDDAHDPLAAGNAHVFTHSVGTALVDGEKVVVTIDRVANHLGGYQLERTKQGQLVAMNPSAVLGGLTQLSREHFYLLLEIEVALGELLVGLRHGEERLHLSVPTQHLASNGIGG